MAERARPAPEVKRSRRVPLAELGGTARAGKALRRQVGTAGDSSVYQPAVEGGEAPALLWSCAVRWARRLSLLAGSADAVMKPSGGLQLRFCFLASYLNLNLCLSSVQLPYFFSK